MDQSLLGGRGHVSVLSCFPPSVGRDVAIAVVKPLGAGLGNPDTHSMLCTDRQVKWTMEVLSYGLTLPLDGDTVKLCVDVYTDWLLSLVSPRDSIPPPISREPNVYAQKILRHLYNLFMPRSEQVSPGYLSLCQQVLRAVQSLARESTMMNRDTWETLLHFLLRINQNILTPPASAGAAFEQMSYLSMTVLFEVWLLSCSRCFPSRALWQTARQMLSGWRCQEAVVETWSRVVTALTSKLLLLTFGPSFPRLNIPDEDAALIPEDFDDERVSHTWFRFLHVLSNPAELRHQPVSGSSPEEVLRGDSKLPNIFLKSMRGVSKLVDGFLGVSVNKSPADQQMTSSGIQNKDRLPTIGVAMTRSPFKDRLPSYGLSRPRSGSAPPTPVNILSVPSAPPSSTSTSPPLPIRRLKPAHVSKAISRSPPVFFSPHPAPSSSLLSSAPRPSPSPLRCNVDSLLHLFGSWLFEAALISRERLPDRWAAGRAEACGTLCRIFTCKKTAEDILPVYLSRFYLVLQQGLQVVEEVSPHVLASILLNSARLFCCDLKGVNLLLPSFTSAVENVLLDRDLLRFKGLVTLVDLRRASVLILMSLLPLPLQFPSIQSEVSLTAQVRGDDVTAGNFLSLKPRLISILIGALHTETDASNTQMLLAAMLNLVQDSAMVEAAGQTQQDTGPQHVGPSRPRQTGGPSGPSAFKRTRGTTIQSDSAAILWVQFVRVLTQRLTAQWRSDSAVCLSALEVLGGLAKVEVNVDESERRRAVTSICTYIVFQCSRPPPLHSRDLHSIIVAAFHCLNIWLTQHPAMLDQQECLVEVLEIVELGISGSKSRQEQEVKSKEEKDLNPASQRVKEAAEATLSRVMQVSESYPSVRGRLDEDAVIGCQPLSDSNVKKFRYFVVDSSVIMAILEPPQKPEEVSNPSVTVLIRGPAGRHSWTLQHHLQPREGRAHRQVTTQQAQIPDPRAVTQEDAGNRSSVKNQMFPENIDRIPSVKADLSIPALQDTVIEETQQQQQLKRLKALFKRQQQVEAHPQVSGKSVAMTTCKAPASVTSFQTARLFLSHLGLLTPETLKDPGTSGVPQLVSLDSSLPGFSEHLRRLDELPSRNRDLAFVFCMRAGQRTAAEILSNVESSGDVSSHFLDFLSVLGRPTEAGRRHMGRVNIDRSEFFAALGDSGGGVFNGEKFVLTYADTLAEITFVVPSSSSHTVDWLMSPEEAELPSRLLSPAGSPQTTTSPAEDVKSSRFVSFVRSEFKLLVVWVELFEDIDFFPLSDLLSEMTTETPTSVSNVRLIFIHPLKTGLYRICFHGNPTSKFGLVIPLVSGSVVSKRCLGFLVREMVINCCHRRRLETDSTPPPHVRRKHMISDIISRYRSRHSEPNFYSALFQDP
ncbi:uncharacterized protein V6R79_003686 [Siganus canaliculatus]